MIQPDTIEKAKELLDLLRSARDLRSHLVVHPSDTLQLFGLDKMETLNCETNVTALAPDLRIAVVDFLIERLEARLSDIDVALP